MSEGHCPACGEYVEDVAVCCSEEKAKVPNSPPPAPSKSRLARLEAQLKDPNISDSGRETLKRVIKALKKARMVKNLLGLGDDGKA